MRRPRSATCRIFASTFTEKTLSRAVPLTDIEVFEARLLLSSTLDTDDIAEVRELASADGEPAADEPTGDAVGLAMMLSSDSESK